MQELASVPDEELMLRAGKRDTEAFEEIISRHEKKLINYFFRLHWDRHRAEDQAQEVFLRLFTHAGEYLPTARFTTYMFRVAHNYWVDDVRRISRDKTRVSLDAASGEDSTSLRELVVGTVDDPSDKLRKEEIVETVIKAVDTLSEEHRAVFLLAEIKGMRYAEIAEALSIPEGTVKSRMHTAIGKLRVGLAHLDPSRARQE